MRYIRIALLVIAICVLSGCTIRSRIPTAVIVEDYLKNKYGIETEYGNPRGGGPTLSMPSTSTFTMIEPASGYEIYVRTINLGENKYYIEDNYLAVKYEKDIENILNSIAAETFGYNNAKIFYEVAEHPLSPNLTLESTLDEIISNDTLLIISDMIVSIDKSDSVMLECFADALISKGISGIFKIVYTDDINLNSINSYIDINSMYSSSDNLQYYILNVNDDTYGIDKVH